MQTIHNIINANYEFLAPFAHIIQFFLFGMLLGAFILIFQPLVKDFFTKNKKLDGRKKGQPGKMGKVQIGN